MATGNTVTSRVEQARVELRARDVILGIALVTVLGFALVLAQTPMAHDGLHNFRHAAGIICH